MAEREDHVIYQPDCFFQDHASHLAMKENHHCFLKKIIVGQETTQEVRGVVGLVKLLQSTLIRRVMCLYSIVRPEDGKQSKDKFSLRFYAYCLKNGCKCCKSFSQTTTHFLILEQKINVPVLLSVSSFSLTAKQ